ncbi:hypothetical protein [Amycolatopsis minnesotensis]|uniref:Sugar-specific transcriptional regulator TrmB n=1 Tax=Amycolatopsis minnesotensis TaxID=337894 RepID=A0ABN2SAT5_9PSEU
MSTSSYDPEAARTTALGALRAWARNRDRLPTDRAELLALAWYTGNRNVAELARLADISRDIVYADLKSAGIDVADRAAAVDVPRYEPLRADTVAAIADLLFARVGPSMLTENPSPLTNAAWMAAIALQRISELLTDAPSTDQDDRIAALDDLAARGEYVTRSVHKLMAAEIPAERLVQYTDNTASTGLDLAEPIITAATLTLALPNQETITLTLDNGGGKPVTVHGESPHLTGQPDAAAHLHITHALTALALALTTSLSGEALAYDE